MVIQGGMNLQRIEYYRVQSTEYNRRLRSHSFTEPATTPRFLKDEAVIIVPVDRSSRPSWPM